MEWKLAEAKNKFSELITRALEEGPQRVRRRSESVFVLSEDEYSKLIGERPQFKDFLLKSGPLLDDLDLTRDTSAMRDAKL